MTENGISVLITGANRGIGLEFVRQYLASGAKVFACCRNPDSATQLIELAAKHDTLSIHPLDVGEKDQIDSLIRALGGQPIDILVNNAGIYGSTKRLELDKIEADQWLETFRINTLAPFLLTRALLPNLQSGSIKKIAMLSSKMGSVSDNSSGGSYYYRSSKSALNQVVKSLSHDLAALGIKIVALHPGWVQTDMGGSSALITAEESVNGLRKVIDKLDDCMSGQFMSYDGQAIGW